MTNLSLFANKIIYFLLFFLIVTILSILFYNTYLKKSKNTIIPGILLNSNKIKILSLSMLYVHYVFYLYFTLLSNDVSSIFLDYNFYMIAIPLLLFDIINGKIIRVIVDIIKSIILYYLVFIKIGFSKYIIYSSGTLTLKLLTILLCALAIIYDTYIVLKYLKGLMRREYEKNYWFY